MKKKKNIWKHWGKRTKCIHLEFSFPKGFLIYQVHNYSAFQPRMKFCLMVDGSQLYGRRLISCHVIMTMINSLTPSQTTNFRFFRTERVWRRKFYILWKWWKVVQKGRKTLWEKEKLLVTSNFAFSHSVFKSSVLQTQKTQGLFGKGLTLYLMCQFWALPIQQQINI